VQETREEGKLHQRADDNPRPKEKEATQNIRKGLKYNTENKKGLKSQNRRVIGLTIKWGWY